MSAPRIGFVFLALIATALPCSAAPVPVAKPPEALPATTVAAWEKVGAEAGWLGQCTTSNGLEFRRDRPPRPGDVPAFRLKERHSGLFDHLPIPTQPFGLDLDAVGIY